MFGGGAPERQSSWRARDVFRLVLIVTVGLYLVSGVVLRQWLDVRAADGSQLKQFPAWRMFSSVSKGVTQVRYIERRPGGKRRVLDRFELLNVERADQPRGVWRVKGRHEALALGERLCRELGPGVRVEMVTRTAARGDWSKPRRDRNVCKETP